MLSLLPYSCTTMYLTKSSLIIPFLHLLLMPPLLPPLPLLPFGLPGLPFGLSFGSLSSSDSSSSASSIVQNVRPSGLFPPRGVYLFSTRHGIRLHRNRMPCILYS